MKITIRVKWDVARRKIRLGNRHRGNEIAQNAFHGVRRNTPDPEESQDVINAKGVEVAAHLFETLLPPGEAVILHSRPVISGKPPILSLFRKRIGRRASLHVEVIK